MSWKVELRVDDSGEWEADGVRFETEQEALAYARDLEFRWAAVREKRVVQCDDPVNYRWTAHSSNSARSSKSSA